MKFWIFMFSIDLFMSVMMIVFGKYLIKKAERFKCPFGYNTNFSVRSEAAWEFSNLLIGRLWFIGGLIFAPIAVTIMIYNIQSELYTVARVGGAICALSGLYMAFSALITAILLRTNFDKDGNKKK